ncbi:MAG TPA: ATP-binding protein [Candidatus Paceibacterota bacterium]|nr:ATP-binding protein [Candidatus Paceibacterota bacterium]
MHFLSDLLPPHTLTRRHYIAAGVLFIVYFLAARIGGQLYLAPAVVYPAAGIALGVLVLEGIWLWPAIFFAALFNYALAGSATGYILLLPFAHTLQAVIGALLLKQCKLDPLVRRLRDMFALMAVALIASVIVPTGGLLAVWFNTHFVPGFHSSITWGSWWTGMTLSLLVIAPLIIRWGAEPTFRRTPRQILEICSVFAVLLGIDWALFMLQIPQVGGISLVYFLLVPLFWLAIRIGPRFTILGLFCTTVIAILGTVYGPNAAALDAVQLGNRLFQLEIFINIIAVIFYIIAGLQEERTEVTKALKSYIDKLEDALNRLSLNDRAKSDFIAILAHELRNPLAPIVSSLEFMRLTPRPPEEEEALDLMDDRLKTIQRLLDDLLDVSRIERSKIRLKTEVADLRQILQHSAQSIEWQMQNRRQVLTVSVPETPLLLQADPVRIEQVVTNLLTNASKFTNEGGQISLSVAREGDVAAISVIDNGIGIEPSMMERIFEPFLQLETGTRMGEGLGIGLSLTKKLVEMHAGTIEARSEGAQRGSVFIVRLPLMTAAAMPSIHEKGAAQTFAEATQGEGRVLVVDDNIAAAQGIGKLLAHKGYSVAYASTGDEARKKVHVYRPHTIVLDIGLPDTDGYSLARLLRIKDGYEGLLVALTGYGQAEDKERAKEAGFDYHLTKPISIMDLVAILPPSA